MMSKEPERDLIVYGPFHNTFFNILRSFRRKYPEYDINLTYYAAHPTPTIEKIKRELEAGHPTADVVMLPHYTTLTLKEKGFLKPYFAAELDEYPSIFKDKDGFWSAIAVEPTEAVYNPRIIKSDSLPTSLADLANPQLEGKVAIQSVMDRSEGMFSFYFLATLLKILGEKRWTELISNFIRTVKPKSFPCYHNLHKYVARGDFGIGLPLPVIKIGWSVNTLNLKEIPSISSLRSIAMLEKGAHPIAAKLFYDYLLSEEWQTKMGKEVEGLIPSRPGIRMKYDAQFRRDDIVFFPTENDVRDSDEFSDKFKAVGIP